MPLDPFSTVYDRIVAIIQNDPTLKRLVRTANLIRFDANPQPLKRAFQAGDAPEIMIEPVTGIDQWASTSTSAKATVTWSIKIATNDLRLYFKDAFGNDSGVFALKWALMVALDYAGDGLALLNGANQLSPLPFCRSSRITASVNSPFDPAGNPISEGRGSDGWTLLATLTNELDFNRDTNGMIVFPNGFDVTSFSLPVLSGGIQVTSGAS